MEVRTEMNIKKWKRGWETRNERENGEEERIRNGRERMADEEWKREW
jgi:hypothetical protein